MTQEYVALITDSTADLGAAEVATPGVGIVPLTLLEMVGETPCARMLAGSAPRTSQGAPDDFARHQEPTLSAVDYALCLPVSADLSEPCAPAAR